jgi:hypothetical protein
MMMVFGLPSISPYLAAEGYFVKCVLNSSAAVFFPGTIQHRDVKQERVSYEDDYRGNAMAATITPGMIDVRFHRDYPDEKVRSIFKRLLALTEMEWARGFTVRYQGRVL